ncbi:toll-like receptor 2 type-2 [Lingula anatina]|uniref:Toll-like receptor 2 type-2 n=1 Tax=Lingula anatina TaxID=7574 RepID=A0A1S3I9I3_LINAN|nr:toll-like receptor 2 type-2 [Lingula anatina]|eukprot:XP_013394853.1 toll-like receptor 2 type-2 [Lingula anatina]
MSRMEVFPVPRKCYFLLYQWCLVSVIVSTGGYKAQRCPAPCHCDFTSLSLGIVNCSYSPIRALSLDILIPRNTTVLDLRYTGLTEIPPHAFSQLENLKVLYVGGNDITHFHEDSFAGLWNLEHLDLSPLHPGTNFDYEAFPVNLFHNLTMLEVLIFGEMSTGALVQQDYLDQTIAPLHRLQQLYIPGLLWHNLRFGPGYSNLTSLRTVMFKGDGSKTYLRRRDFVNLKNCPIERLAFIGCGLSGVEYGTLSSFPQLKTLDIEVANFISVREVEQFICDLKNTSIESLRLCNIFSRQQGKAPVSQWVVSANTFHCLKNTSLKTLELLRDRIEAFDYQNLLFLTHLEYVDLSGNNLLFSLQNGSDINGWRPIARTLLLLPNLVFLRIDNNLHDTTKVTAQDIPPYSFWYGRPEVPLEPAKHVSPLHKVHQDPLHNLDLQYPILKVSLPENLEFWCTSWWASLTYDIVNYDTVQGSILFSPNKLRYLKLEGIPLKALPYVIYGLDRLEFLDISHGGWYFVPKTFFNNFISLIYLYLKDNNLGPLIAKGGLHPMQLSHLEILDLSVNKISTIPKDFFRYLVSLKRLDISDNRISKLSFTMTNFHSIELIDISTNQLTTLSTSELDFIRKMNASSLNVTLNVINNPMDCNVCDGRGFLHWIVSSNMTIIFSNDSTCYVNGSKTSLESSLRRLERECDSSPQTIISSNQWLSLGASIGSISAVACGLIVAYIYRWNIKYRFFLLRRRFRKRGVITATPGHVYASYDDNDYYWVTHVLLRHLEDEDQLDVIIDQRDFIGGASLSEAIVEAVENSRKTVLVLSESYVLNPWCEFEFQMSLARSYQSVIPVMFQPVPFDAMTKSLRKYIRARGYIKWTDNPEGQRLFWNRLSDAIFDVNNPLEQVDEDEIT